MSILVPINGVNYIIPTPGETGWGSNLDSFFVAISAGVLQKNSSNFLLSNEVDFGAAFGLKSLYYKSETANIASTGILRLANASDAISWRNATNSADLPLAVNASDQLTFNGIPIVEDTSTLPIILPNATVTGTTATATTGGSLSGTYYYKVYPVFGASVGGPSEEKTVVVTGGNNATALSWSSVTGATGYRVSRGGSSGSQDGYYAVSGTNYTDTGASFTATGNAFSQASANWLTLGGNIVMPASSGGIFFRNYATGAIDGNIAQTSAGELQYQPGTAGINAGVHYFQDASQGGLFQFTRVGSSNSEFQALNGLSLNNMDITYGTSLNLRPGNSTVWTINSGSILSPAGTAANPIIDLASEHTGIYRQGAGVLGITLSGVAAYNFLSTDFRPSSDNVQNLGSGGARWATLRLATSIVAGGTNTITTQYATPSASRAYTVPDAGGAANYLLSGWGQIVNADISVSAAIAYSKLALTNSIVNADINSSAAIAYSKLNLTGDIVNADISASAAITRSKLATGTAWQILADDGAGAITGIGFGASGQVLTSTGATSLPTFQNVAGTGTVNSGTQFQLAYYATSTNAVSGLTLITASRALVSDTNGLPVAATTTTTELQAIHGLTASRALQTDGSGLISVNATTSTELGFVSGVTSAIQTQINAKAPTANPTFTGVILAPNGSAGAPSYSFTTDATTGVFLNSSNVLSFSTGSTERLQIQNTTIVVVNNLQPDADNSRILGTGPRRWASVSTLQVTSNGNGVAVEGVSTNSNATAGFVGETASSTATPTGGLTNVYSDGTSLSLTAGDWLVTALGSCITGTATTTVNVGISTTSGNSSTGLVSGDSLAEFGDTNVSGGVITLSVPSYRVSLSTLTTVYLKIRTIGSNSNTWSGVRLSAVRIR